MLAGTANRARLTGFQLIMRQKSRLRAQKSVKTSIALLIKIIEIITGLLILLTLLQQSNLLPLIPLLHILQLQQLPLTCSQLLPFGLQLCQLHLALLRFVDLCLQFLQSLLPLHCRSCFLLQLLLHTYHFGFCCLHIFFKLLLFSNSAQAVLQRNQIFRHDSRRCCHLLLFLFVQSNNRINQGQYFFNTALVMTQSKALQLLRICGINAADAVQRLLASALLLGKFVTLGRSILLQLLLQLLEEVCMKQITEDFTALIRIGIQKFAELSLRNHRYLRKLLMIKPQQLHYAFIYLRHSRYRHAVIGIVQLGAGLLLRHASAALCRTAVLRVTFYPVALAAEGKLQLHKRRRIGIRILAAQHVGITHTATRLPVQGIGNGIKNYGFTGSCITGNQIQSLLTELGKIYHGLPRIRTKRTHNQLQRSHNTSPPISDSKLVRYCFCSSLNS